MFEKKNCSKNASNLCEPRNENLKKNWKLPENVVGMRMKAAEVKIMRSGIR